MRKSVVDMFVHNFADAFFPTTDFSDVNHETHKPMERRQ